MFITETTLERFNACENGKKWFARHFPEGGELVDVINHRLISPEMLHWGYTNLPTSYEERAAYWTKLAVDEKSRSTAYESDNIINSSWVSKSSRIDNASYIFSSKDIKNCEDILLSEMVEDSTLIFGSEFVYSSSCILHSKNINNSRNIINSNYVVNSHSITNAVTVTNSAYVSALILGGTSQIRDSRFIADCHNLKHCLFCHNIKDSEYKIFNKQVDEADYELIVRQLDNILMAWEVELVKNNEWPTHTIPLDMPIIQRHLGKQWRNLPEKFWRWVRTLPGYDKSIMYTLTYNGDLL